jgi:hypothetical protein
VELLGAVEPFTQGPIGVLHVLGASYRPAADDHALRW